MRTIILLGFLFSILTQLFAQNGKITGVVKDGEFNDVLPFANVQIKNSDKGTTTDLDGVYEISLPAGTYTIIFSSLGYQNLEISDVIVTAYKTYELNATIQPASNQLKEIVITASTAKNTEASLINIQRQSVQVMNGISAEGLTKTGASNVANAVKSIPGVSVQGDKYVFVRGLGDRYTKTILNGVDIPGLDPDRNTVQMDIFPSNILDNIQVIKSATADLDADFTGGMVNIVTKDFPATKNTQFSIGAQYQQEAHFNNAFLVSPTSSTDFLGFDDGLRKLPISRNIEIPAPYAQDPVLYQITQAFKPELKAKNKSMVPDFTINFSHGNQKNLGQNKLGYLVALGYKKYADFDDTKLSNKYAKNIDPILYELEERTIQKGSVGTQGVMLNGLIGLSYKSQKSKYSLNLMHIQNGESNASKLHKFEYFSNNIEIFSDYIEYNQRSISNLQLNGKHTSTSGNWITEWTISPTYSSIQDKDIRYTPFEYTSAGTFAITPSGAGAPRRNWRALTETNAVSKIDVTKKHQLFKNDAKFKIGAKYTYKERDYSIDQYFITLYNSSGTQFNGNADALLLDENLWNVGSTSGTYIVGNYEPANTFNAYNWNAAIYISEEFNLTEKLKTIAGFRVENFQQFFTGQNNQSTIVFKNKNTIDQFKLYPSLNLIYKATEKANVRLSYYLATARPSFKETSIIGIYDPISNLTYNGNINLQPSEIQNLDLKLEWFRNDDELMALSAFYKDFTNPIELTFYGTSFADQVIHRNIGKAQVFGGEIELRQNFDFISNTFKNLSLNLNFSYIISEQEMDKTTGGEYESKKNVLRTGESLKDTRTLQGQSPYLFNAGLGYKNKGWQSNLAYNIQGKTLDIVGLGVIPDVYVLPFNSLNFNISKNFGADEKSSIKLQINNVLNEYKTSVFQSYQAQDQIFSQKTEGIKWGISYQYKF